MSALRNLEEKIAGAVEGTFSRIFRSAVRPVEIARKLSREMEEHQSQSLSHTYVPNEYRVYLSPRDRERFESYEEALATELGSYLLEHARRERFTLLSPPVIEFETDARLGLGQFGIETRTVTPDGAQGAPPAQERARQERGETMVYSDAQRIAQPLSAAASARQQRALLLYNGQRIVVGPSGAALGRSRECDIVVDDSGVSRRHAEVRSRGGAWMLSDLGSTNGSRLNGRVIDKPELIQSGDEIKLGSSSITFELE